MLKLQNSNISPFKEYNQYQDIVKKIDNQKLTLGMKVKKWLI